MSKAGDYLQQLQTDLDKQREICWNTNSESPDFKLETFKYAERRAAYKAAKQMLILLLEDLAK